MTDRLKPTEFNSLMMYVMSRRSAKIDPPTLLKNYVQNRFVGRIPLDVIAFRKQETAILEFAAKSGFEAIEFSPAAPLGSCSVTAPVDQNKIISATRGVELVSDVTNLMALEYAMRRKSDSSLQTLSLAAVHRVVRAQYFEFEGFTPHFSLLSLATMGRDQGNFDFESQQLSRHIELHLDIIRQFSPQLNGIGIDIYEIKSSSRASFNRVWNQVRLNESGLEVRHHIRKEEDNNYYSICQFKISFAHEGESYEICDGGFVDWSKTLTQDNKSRMIISAMGTERFLKTLI